MYRPMGNYGICCSCERYDCWICEGFRNGKKMHDELLKEHPEYANPGPITQLNLSPYMNPSALTIINTARQTMIPTNHRDMVGGDLCMKGAANNE